MGGAILLMNAHSGRSPFERLALTAPMIDIWGIRLPRAARLLAESLDTLGFGGAFVPFGKPDSVMSKPFAGNVLTGDPGRYARSAAILAANPDLGPRRSDHRAGSTPPSG
jgi:lysophospholipase